MSAFDGTQTKGAMQQMIDNNTLASRTDDSVTQSMTTSRNIMQTPMRRRKGRKPPFLSTFEQAPAHLRDNQFIRRGYRVGHGFKDAIMSLVKVHNETGNIWTHLIGFIIFVLLTVATLHIKPAPLQLGLDMVHAIENKWASLGKENLYELVSTVEEWERSLVKYGTRELKQIEQALKSIGTHNIREYAKSVNILSPFQRGMTQLGNVGFREMAALEKHLANASYNAVYELEELVSRSIASVVGATWPVKRWPMHIFTIGAMICLLTSSVCHLFGCCPAHIATVMWRFDYAGIAVLIVTSFYPPVYYGFLCQPSISALYILLISMFGLATLTVTLLDRFQDPSFHAYRASLFSILGLLGAFPLIHGFRLHQNIGEVHTALFLEIAMGLLYLLGALIYACKIPERWLPGKFDLAFHSHQIFHVAVVAAALVHYRACSILLHWRDASGGCFTTLES